MQAVELYVLYVLAGCLLIANVFMLYQVYLYLTGK